jgi:hypothetical protein
MKRIISGIAMAAIILAACHNRNNNSTESLKVNNNSQTVSQTDNKDLTTSLVNAVGKKDLIKEIVSTYLQMKNAFTEDNSSVAATSGKKLEAAFINFDKSTLTAAQKKTYEDVESDAREHAEHIGTNGGNIEHQREHFELLSKDIYDLVKALGSGQVLFKDFDPMFNNGKGAFWLSETKEIKNPYMGKAMLTSGSIKEEIK